MTRTGTMTQLFVIFDAAFIVVSMLAGLELPSLLAISLGLALTYPARKRAPYAFMAAQHCAVYVSFVPIYILFYGLVPGVWRPELPHLDLAAAVIVLGLGALTLGIACGVGPNVVVTAPSALADPRRLWIAVLTMFSVDWIVRLENNLLSGGFTQIFNEVLKFRYFFLVLLVLIVLIRRRGGFYAISAALFVMLPQATSHMSGWSAVLVLAAYTTVTAVYLAGRAPFTGPSPAKAVRSLVFAGAATLAFGIIWSGGLKPAWRAAVLHGEVTGPTIERLTAFGGFFVDAIQNLSLDAAIAELSSRTGSGVVYGALTIGRVPRVLPHEDGALSGAAVAHILTPRLLFPDKPALASDSELIRQYTGLAAAGAESNTSIGLGYIIEFFIDFGFAGAVVCCLAFGLYIGCILRLWHTVCPDRLLVHTAGVVLAWSSLNTYDASLVKMVGSITMQGVVFSFLLYLVYLYRAKVERGDALRPAPLRRNLVRNHASAARPLRVRTSPLTASVDVALLHPGR